MAQDYHHCVRVVEVNEGTQSITTVSTSIVGMVNTDDDADASVFPLNNPVLLTDVLTASGKAGESGMRARSLDAISDQAKPVTVVMRVAHWIKSKSRRKNPARRWSLHSAIHGKRSASSVRQLKDSRAPLSRRWFLSTGCQRRAEMAGHVAFRFTPLCHYWH